MKQINSNYNTRGRKTKFFSVVGSNDKVHFTTIMEDVTEREAMIEAGRPSMTTSMWPLLGPCWT